MCLRRQVLLWKPAAAQYLFPLRRSSGRSKQSWKFVLFWFHWCMGVASLWLVHVCVLPLQCFWIPKHSLLTLTLLHFTFILPFHSLSLKTHNCSQSSCNSSNHHQKPSLFRLEPVPKRIKQVHQVFYPKTKFEVHNFRSSLTESTGRHTQFYEVKPKYILFLVAIATFFILTSTSNCVRSSPQNRSKVRDLFLLQVYITLCLFYLKSKHKPLVALMVNTHGTWIRGHGFEPSDQHFDFF
jgi:hypothetical protein